MRRARRDAAARDAFGRPAPEAARGAAARDDGGRRGRSHGRTRTVVVATVAGVVAVSGVATAAGARPADVADVLRLGSRSATVKRTTTLRARTAGEALRLTNAGRGGALLASCRAAGSRACLRATNPGQGQAFAFSTAGPLGGTLRVGRGGDAARPFTTNATGVASGLNADRLDGRDAADFLPARGTAADAAALGGLPASAFARAGAPAPAAGGNADTLGGLPPSAFVRADAPPPGPADGGDADTLGGVSPDGFARAERIARLRTAQPLAAGEDAVLGTAQGIGVRARCVDTGGTADVAVDVSTDTADTRFASSTANAFAQVDVSPADGFRPVLTVDDNVVSAGEVASISVSLLKPTGTVLAGTLTVGRAWGGGDCFAALSLLG